MTLTLGKTKCREKSNVCVNYELNRLHHVGVVAKRVRAAAAAEAEAEPAAQEWTTIPLRPNGPRGKHCIAFYGSNISLTIFKRNNFKINFKIIVNGYVK